MAAWLADGSFRLGLSAVAAADPAHELVGGVAFVVSLVATALTWRLVFRTLGARITPLDACGRYAAGSVVNTFCPARLGDAARAALFARSLPSGRGRVATAAGALGAMGIARGLVAAGVIGTAAGLGAVPFWPVVVLAGLAGCGAVAALVLHRTGRSRRLAELVEATATLVSRPRLGLGLVALSLLAVLARIVAATAVLAAVGVPRPLPAAIAVTAALDIAGAFPVTPGGVGITSGAISLVLASRGVGFLPAFAAGVVFHAVETASSLGFAGAVALVAARVRIPPVVRVAAAAAAIALVAAFVGPMLVDAV